MATTNQQLASLVANLTANTVGNITGANIANYTGNLFTFISNNGTSVQSVGVKSSTASGFSANYTLTLPVSAGTSGYLMSTDGTGVMSWIAPPAGTQILNGNSNVVVAGNANVTMAVTSTNAFTLATNLVAIGANAGAANAGANSVYIGRAAALDGNSYANVVVINGGNTTLNPTVANATFMAPFRTDNTANNIANSVQVSYDTVTKEVRSGNPVFPQAFERLTLVTTAPPTTVNLDVIGNSITYYSNASNVATSNVTLNVRGNSTTTLNSMLPVGHSIGVSFIMTNGAANAYYANVFQVDGTAATVTARTATGANAAFTGTTLIHTYTIVKLTSAPTYSVFYNIVNYS